MKTKTLRRKTVGKKGCFLALIIAALFLIATPPLAAQQGQEGYGGQQGEKGYGGQRQQQQHQQSQQEEYQYQDPAQQQQPADFNQETLQKFAEARSAVDEIRDEYTNELSDIDDAKKARELQNKYTQKMIDAIEDEDLSVKKYNDVSRATQSSPELQKKVENLSN